LLPWRAGFQKLAFPQDRLPALAGMAIRRGTLHKLTYVAGLWKENLAKEIALGSGADPGTRSGAHTHVRRQRDRGPQSTELVDFTHDAGTRTAILRLWGTLEE
jgi:hypothetical protein